MKKIAILSYLILTSFVCIGQSVLCSYTEECEPFVYLEDNGYFQYEYQCLETPGEEYFAEMEFHSCQIHYQDYGVELENNGYTITLVYSQDCKWVQQYVFYDNGIIVDMYSFHVPKSND